MKKWPIYLLFCVLLGNLPVFLNAQDGNTVHGTAAGENISTGDFITAIGDSAGYNTTSGSYNTFIGKSAGFSLDNDLNNTIIGAFANYLGTSGIDNVIIGKFAGYSNGATDNTFIGKEAGLMNTIGNDNTFIGEEAGKNNIDGDNNTFVGEDAGFNNTIGNDNTFIGRQAGRTNILGYRNTAVGNEALFDLGRSTLTPLVAHHNTAVGDSAGIDNGSGLYNTYIGAAAGATTEYADYNTFVGYFSGGDNNRTNSTDNANRNTYVGAKAGFRNRIGEDNVGIGAFAEFEFNGFSTTDFAYSRNTFVGAYSGVFAKDGVAIGFMNQVKKDFGTALGSKAISDGVNSTAIGYQASVNASNEIYLGNSSITSIGGIVNWTATSDERFKNSIEENVVGLDFIDRLRPVTYKYDAAAMHSWHGFEIGSLEESFKSKEKIRYSGFIAQEVEQAAAQCGFDFSGIDRPQNESDVYGLRYAEFTVPIIKAVQELHEKVKSQEQVIDRQEKELQAYRALFSELENRLKALENQGTIQADQHTVPSSQ